MERELQWWKGQLAADIHQSLRIKELKLPVYRAHSPQIGMRRYFADLLAILSNRYQLCPTARHLAVYLLDLFMDHYDVAVKQLYVIALSCLLLASKFEEKEDRVPKLEQLNSLGFMCSLNLVLNKKDLIKMELLLLETFGWNLCMPTPAHFIDYYLHASVQEGDLYNGWPLSSLSKTKAFMDNAHDNDVKEANKTKSTPPHRPSSLQSQPQTSHLSPVSAIQRPASSSSSTSSTPQLLFQPDGFPHLTQHSPSLSQLQALADSQALGPVVNMSQDFIQSHRMGLLTGASSMTPGSGFPSYPSLTSGLQPGARALPLQGSHFCADGPRWGAPPLSEHGLQLVATWGLITLLQPAALTDLLSLSVSSATPSACPAPPSLSQRRLKRKQRSKGKTDPVEVITLT
ncbi:Cyclin-J [Collichthys lucidus]|uniref:Cyclin-J n=1 Tax=Collichthys lucidus TaxID=240159 RepID=A0A4U5UGE2_COLLU|nr:Cyclin-J [Collichthys lucidus]